MPIAWVDIGCAAGLAAAVLLWGTGAGRRARRRPPDGADRRRPGSGRVRPAARTLLGTGRRPGARPGWAADLADLAGLGLEAGLPGDRALGLALDFLPGEPVQGTRDESRATPADRLATGHVAMMRGDLAVSRSPADVLVRLVRDGSAPEGLDVLATAWRLSERHGAPAAKVVRVVAAALRARDGAARRRAALLAGPRASMRLLTLLPVSGPVLCWLVGLPVGEVYGAVVPAVLVLLGLLLTGLGWQWCRVLLARAARPTFLRPPSGGG